MFLSVLWKDDILFESRRHLLHGLFWNEMPCTLADILSKELKLTDCNVIDNDFAPWPVKAYSLTTDHLVIHLLKMFLVFSSRVSLVLEDRWLSKPNSWLSPSTPFPMVSKLMPRWGIDVALMHQYLPRCFHCVLVVLNVFGLFWSFKGNLWGYRLRHGQAWSCHSQRGYGYRKGGSRVGIIPLCTTHQAGVWEGTIPAHLMFWNSAFLTVQAIPTSIKVLIELFPLLNGMVRAYICHFHRCTTHTCWSTRSAMLASISPQVQIHMKKWTAKALRLSAETTAPWWQTSSTPVCRKSS